MTTSSVTTLLRAPLMIIGAILILLWVDVRLALVMLVFLPIVDRGAGLLPAQGRAALPQGAGPLRRRSTRCCRRTWPASASSRRSCARTTRTPASTSENTELQHAATAAQSSAAFLNPALLLVDQPRARRRALGRRRPRDRREDRARLGVRAPQLPGRGDDPARPAVACCCPQIASADSSVGRVLEVLERGARRGGQAGRPEPGRGGRWRGARVASPSRTSRFSYLGPDGKPNPSPVLSDIDLVAEPGQVVGDPRRDRLRASRRS